MLCGTLLSAHCMTNTVLKYSQLELGGIVVLQLSLTEKALRAELLIVTQSDKPCYVK